MINDCDQGPWGGHREIIWRSVSHNSFSFTELIDYADDNGWKLADSISVSLDTITKSIIQKLRADDYSLDLLRDRILPSMNARSYTIFVFKTSWLAVEPGNARETFENGFAVVDSDGTEMRVFHIWGE